MLVINCSIFIPLGNNFRMILNFYDRAESYCIFLVDYEFKKINKQQRITTNNPKKISSFRQFELAFDRISLFSSSNSLFESFGKSNSVFALGFFISILFRSNFPLALSFLACFRARVALNCDKLPSAIFKITNRSLLFFQLQM